MSCFETRPLLRAVFVRRALVRAVLAHVLMIGLLCCLPAPARSDGSLATSGYVEYSHLFGDIYNGVTTDDGELLGGSYTVKGRVNYGRLSAVLSYRSDLSQSQVNATTPTGQPGTSLTFPAGAVIVPQFVAVDAQFEARLEYGLQQLPVYFGVAYSNATNNYGFPTLHAFGVGVEVQPSTRRALSPYGSFFYFPNQTGVYPLANPNNPASGSVTESLHANEFEVGASYTIPRTQLNIVGGYQQTTNVSRTGSFNFVLDGPFLGVGYRFR